MAALDSVRPYMESHGGNIELLGFEDGVVKLRLEGSCKSCRASSSTLELAVRQALQEAAPDLLGMDVEGVVEEEPGGCHGRSAAARERSSFLAHARYPGTRAPHRRPHVDGMSLVVANVDGTLLAYRDRCASCSSTLGGRHARSAGRSPVRPAAAGTSCLRRGARWTTSISSSSRSRSCARPRRSGWRCEAARRGRGEPAPGADGLRACAGWRSRSRRSRAEQLGSGRALRPLQHDRSVRPPAHAQPVRAPDRVRVRELLGAPLGRPGLPADREPHAVARGLRAARGAVGAVPDPDRARVLHALDRDELHRRDVSEPGGRDRERAPLRDLEPARRR